MTWTWHLFSCGKYGSDIRPMLALHTTLAETASESNKLEEAVRHCTAAIALRPDSAGLHLNLGFALNEQGKHEEAIVQYREALRIQPEYSMAHNNLGIALATKASWTRPSPSSARPSDSSRTTLKLTTTWATCCAIKAKWRRHCRVPRGHPTQPDYAEAHYNLGHVLLRTRQAGGGHRRVPRGHPTQAGLR